MRLSGESPANNIMSLRFTGLLLDCESNHRFECDLFTALEKKTTKFLLHWKKKQLNLDLQDQAKNLISSFL